MRAKSSSRSVAVYFVPGVNRSSNANNSNAADCPEDPSGQGRPRAIRSTVISWPSESSLIT